MRFRPFDVRVALWASLLLTGPTATLRAQTTRVQFAALERHGIPARSEWTSSLALGDVDGDGDLDLIIGGDGVQSRLLRNDGRGRFEDVTATHLPAEADLTLALALGDVDGDGDLDLFLANESIQGRPNRLYLNDGRGRFTDVSSSHLPPDRDFTRAALLADVDGDGRPDLVTAHAFCPQTALRLLRNVGGGRFETAPAGFVPAIPLGCPYSLVAGDLDGDGDIDLVVGTTGPNHLLRNDGTGRFALDAGALAHVLVVTDALALGDVDGDGDLDLVEGNGFAFFGEGERNRLLRNDGGGRFVEDPAALPLDFHWTHALALGDLDGDGDLDLVAGNLPNLNNQVGGQDQIYRNDGTGRFANVTTTSLAPNRDPTYALALGDLDADGDLDLVAGNGFHRPDRVLVNLLRQLHAPAEPRHGQAYRLAFHAETGFGTLPHVFLPLLAHGLQHTPLPPFGTLALDLRTLVLLDPVYVHPRVGPATLDVVLPADPVLVGEPIASQALDLGPFGNARFTNAVFDVIR